MDKLHRWDSHPNSNPVLKSDGEKSALVSFPEKKMSRSLFFLPGCFPVPVTTARHHLWTSTELMI